MSANSKYMARRPVVYHMGSNDAGLNYYIFDLTLTVRIFKRIFKFLSRQNVLYLYIFTKFVINELMN